jgi:hypothetical protein
MSKVEVNQISSQCGSTLTIGQSGDTVTLAAGATQTGFGRSGSVNWDTTAKTASFTAVSGNGYFVNTTSGAITVTLPATPSAGDIVAINDYGRTFATNNVTVGRNGSNIQGVATDATISTNGQSIMFVYVDGTQGWLPTEDQTTGNYGALYVTATGGTVTCCGDYKIHTFTGPGTFCVSCAGNPAGSTQVDYLVVAGGGGGGTNRGAGGGGAGGYRESSGTVSGCYSVSPLGACVSALPVSATTYPITVGGGGAALLQGNNSIFNSITSTGGGGGGGNGSPCATAGSGGSGGGGQAGSPTSTTGAAGNTPPVSPPQGNPGGNAVTASPTSEAGGGGGGATAAGQNAPGGDVAGNGGAGASNSITGSAVTYAGGGGAAASAFCSSKSGGAGGAGGGGNGKVTNDCSGFNTAGTANTGGGGGAGNQYSPSGITVPGEPGGSGIVIIRYKYQ